MKRLKQILLIVTLLYFACAKDMYAQDKDRSAQVVRVGCYDSPFWQTDSLGKRSGYAYDYLRRIANNTGWRYEYVEGEWPELLRMLIEGKIDILDNVSYKPERDEMMLFSERSMGLEDYFIVALVDHPDIEVGDIPSLNGKTIGVDAGSFEEPMFRDWVKKSKLNIKIEEFNLQGSDYMALLKGHKVDAIVASTSLYTFLGVDVVPVVNISSAPYYFAISKQRPELKAQIDYAMEHIHIHNTYYNSQLHDKYFGNNDLMRYLPIREREWIKNHGKIRIAYRDNYMPFCAKHKKTGKTVGLLHDFVEHTKGAFSNANVEFETIAYPTINAAMDAVLKGEADVAFPNAMTGFDAEAMHLYITNSFLTSAEMAVMRNKDYFQPNNKLRVAINANNPNYISLIQNNYPHWEMVHFDSTIDALEGVASGEADLILLSNYRISIMSDVIEDLGLKSIATGLESNHAFTVKEGNSELYSIMNRLSQIPSQGAIQASLADYSEATKGVSVKRFVRNNIIPVALFLVLFILVVLWLLWRAVNANKKARRHLKEISELNTQLEEHQSQLEEVTSEQEAQIEEIQLLNKELTNAQKEADAANAAKTSFLFNMSHDIRTPMNAIMGFTDLLKKHQEEPEKRADYLEKINHSSNVLLSIINNVLEMARIEKGTIVIDETPESVEQFNGVLCSIFSELMKQKGLAFTSSINVQHHRVMCDTTKLREIFYNILSNACKYTKPGGTVDMKLEELPSPREGYVLFRSTVSDTGIGMSEDFLPHLFEEFSRESNTTDNKIEGTGLGMPIVKRLVELMDGTIEVKSKKGVGTSFIVTMPFRIAEDVVEEKASPVESTPADFGGKRILLAEDNDLNAEIAIAVLEDLGFIVERVEDGVQCVKTLSEAEADSYDIILMDVQMPNMDGYEATRTIRRFENSAKARIPILAMTANAFEEDKKNATEAGMNGHLAKPIDVAELMKSLTGVVKG